MMTLWDMMQYSTDNSSEVVMSRMIGTSRTYRLKENFIAFGVKIPKGFVFDGASVPRALWWFMPPMGTEADRAVVVHDWLYATHQVGTQECDRKFADKIFYELMIMDGVPKWKAKTIYNAVRLFGGSNWDKVTQEEKTKITNWMEESFNENI